MTSWVRLWHDMPTDPKFRTIARAAKQPLPTVVAVFTFLLADASANENERGRTTATDEDIASAFDIEEADVLAIKQAMQGRVLDGDMLAGWAKRQPKKEDDSATRAKAWREKKQAENACERLRTLPNEQERPDAETEAYSEAEKKDPPLTPEGGDEAIFNECWQTFPHHPESVKAQARKQFDRLTPAEKLELRPNVKHYRAFWVEECVRRKETQEARRQYVPHLSTWIKSEAWREAMSLPVKAAVSAAVADALEYVDRNTQEELFARCERLRGKPAPSSIQRFGFPREIVAAARAGEGAPA